MKSVIKRNKFQIEMLNVQGYPYQKAISQDDLSAEFNHK